MAIDFYPYLIRNSIRVAQLIRHARPVLSAPNQMISADVDATSKEGFWYYYGVPEM
jgi:hypothetical protein